MVDDADDDLEEYLDPELDPQPGASGPVTVPRVVLGLHVVGAGLVATIGGVALLNDDVVSGLTFVGLSVMLVVAGVAAQRLAGG